MKFNQSKNNEPFNNVEFVKIWMQSENIKEVAEHFPNRSLESVRVHGANLRKKGVRLPKLTRVKKFDPTELNEIIKELRGVK